MWEAQDTTEQEAGPLPRGLLLGQSRATLVALTVALCWSLLLAACLCLLVQVGAPMQHAEYSGGRTVEQIQRQVFADFRPPCFGLALLGWVPAVLLLSVTWLRSRSASRRLGWNQNRESEGTGPQNAVRKN